MEPVQLTDDEVLAIASDRDAPWPGPVPTVRTWEPDQLSSSGARGTRALLVRRLLDDVGTLEPTVSDLTQRVLTMQGQIQVAVCGGDFQRLNWDYSSAHYCTGGEDDGWVLETVTPSGIHSLSVQDRADHAMYLEAMLASAIAEPAPSAPGEPSPWLCAASRRRDGAVIAAARQGELQLVNVDESGTPQLPGRPVTPQQAVAELMAHCSGPA